MELKSTIQAQQQLSPPRFHGGRTVSSRFAQNFHHPGFDARVALRQVSQSLKGERLHDGAAVFKIAAQARHCDLPLPGGEQQPRNHSGQMPRQLLLFGFLSSSRAVASCRAGVTLGSAA